MAKPRKPKAAKAGAKVPAFGRPTHVVLRIIQGAEGGDIFAGTPEEPVYVDACDWANAALLEQSGHLRRITPEECDALEAAHPRKETEVSTEPPLGASIVTFVAITEEGVHALLHRDSCECVYEKPPSGALRAGVFNANSIEDARRTVQRFATDENGDAQPDQNRVATTFGNCLADLPAEATEPIPPSEGLRDFGAGITFASPRSISDRAILHVEESVVPPAAKAKVAKAASKRAAKPKAAKK